MKPTIKDTKSPPARQSSAQAKARPALPVSKENTSQERTSRAIPLAQKVASRLNYSSPIDLLYHYPRRHEDRSRSLDPLAVPIGQPITITGKVQTSRFQRFRGGRSSFEAQILTETNPLNVRLIWFGFTYLKQHLTEGRRIVAFGKLEKTSRGLVMYHPEYELIEAEDEAIHTGRIVPIYPLVDGVTQKMVRTVIYHLVSNEENLSAAAAFTSTTSLPSPIPYPEELISKEKALAAIHFPTSVEELLLARRRLAFEELLHMQMILALRRMENQKVSKIRVLPDPAQKETSLVSLFWKALPFKPTRAQLKACREIDADFAQPYPMNRLLQGDVGSGKTVVAAHTLLRSLQSGTNGALLAPTEILAEQHYLNLKQWLEPLGVALELWTRTKKIRVDEETLFEPNSKIKGKIYVGTHALIQENVKLPNLGACVIDEQHKFGVLQRLAFQKKAEAPDLLVMTATPIPRTLSLTLYGDLDVSILDELPPGRGSLRTFTRSPQDLPKIFDFIEKELNQGRQAYVVYPLVVESEKSDLKSVEKAAKEIRARFGAANVGVLHGKMESEAKEEIMRRFKNKEFGILISTTVIEVGVDVPNATIMLIEEAERFGLAQLHQLRGRVGRGGHHSYCILIGKPEQPESWERLKLMERITSGFEIAEHDLRLRGPGDIIGTAQSGLPPLKIATLARDTDLILLARDWAKKLLSDFNSQKSSLLKEVLHQHIESENTFKG